MDEKPKPFDPEALARKIDDLAMSATGYTWETIRQIDSVSRLIEVTNQIGDKRQELTDIAYTNEFLRIAEALELTEDTYRKERASLKTLIQLLAEQGFAEKLHFLRGANADRKDREFSRSGDVSYQTDFIVVDNLVQTHVMADHDYDGDMSFYRLDLAKVAQNFELLAMLSSFEANKVQLLLAMLVKISRSSEGKHPFYRISGTLSPVEFVEVR